MSVGTIFRALNAPHPLLPWDSQMLPQVHRDSLWACEPDVGKQELWNRLMTAADLVTQIYRHTVEQQDSSHCVTPEKQACSRTIEGSKMPQLWTGKNQWKECLGKIDGSRKRERLNIWWFESTKEAITFRLQDPSRTVTPGIFWRLLIHIVPSPRVWERTFSVPAPRCGTRAVLQQAAFP